MGNGAIGRNIHAKNFALKEALLNEYENLIEQGITDEKTIVSKLVEKYNEEHYQVGHCHTSHDLFYVEKMINISLLNLEKDFFQEDFSIQNSDEGIINTTTQTDTSHPATSIEVTHIADGISEVSLIDNIFYGKSFCDVCHRHFDNESLKLFHRQYSIGHVRHIRMEELKELQELTGDSSGDKQIAPVIDAYDDKHASSCACSYKSNINSSNSGVNETGSDGNISVCTSKCYDTDGISSSHNCGQHCPHHLSAINNTDNHLGGPSRSSDELMLQHSSTSIENQQVPIEKPNICKKSSIDNDEIIRIHYGTKYFWQVKESFQLFVYMHTLCKTIEVIACYLDEKSKSYIELNRIYLHIPMIIKTIGEIEFEKKLHTIEKLNAKSLHVTSRKSSNGRDVSVGDNGPSTSKSLISTTSNAISTSLISNAASLSAIPLAQREVFHILLAGFVVPRMNVVLERGSLRRLEFTTAGSDNYVGPIVQSQPLALRCVSWDTISQQLI